MALPWNNKTGGNQRKIKSGMARPPEPPPIIYLRPARIRAAASFQHSKAYSGALSRKRMMLEPC